MSTLRSLECPVCSRGDLDERHRACPNCGTDLLPIWRIRQWDTHALNRARALAEAGRVEEALSSLCAPLGEGDDTAEHRALLAALMSAQRTGRSRPVRWVVTVALAAVAIFLAVPPLGDRAPQESDTVVHQSVPAPLESREEFPALLLGSLETIAGITARHREEPGGAIVEVVFHRGLFAAGTNMLDPEGRRILSEVAQALCGLGTDLHVEVHGFTDPTPPGPGSPWPDNSALALGRAYAAVRWLQAQATSPTVRWLATATPDASPPYPNDSRANRAKNRTVVLAVAAPR